MRCPYYQVEKTERLLNKVKVYCAGCQEGRLRIPSFYEEEKFCLGENYSNCLLYIARIKAGENKEAIISSQSRWHEYLQHILIQLKNLCRIHDYKILSRHWGIDFVNK